MQRPTFSSIESYGQLFTSVAYWQPYIEEICTRHSLGSCQRVRAGLPGTHPVFIVSEQYVIKLFTYYFGGAESLAVERDLYSIFAQSPPFSIPVPALIAEGTLFPQGDEWSWPYLITNVIPGTSLGEVYEQVSYEDMLALAHSLGLFLRQLHQVNLSQSRIFKPMWDTFLENIEDQRHTCVARQQEWGTLPTHLIAQIEDYLLPDEQLFDIHTTPHLLHCDLNADHVLGLVDERQSWHTRGIIDFGDALVGDWHYELFALHMGLFHADKHLLHVFLDSYDPEQTLRANFTHIAMSYQLLRRFDGLQRFFQENPAAREVKRLEELAEILWEVY